MSSFGVLLKRKSVEKVEPVLPRQKKQREPSREGRTVYKQLRPPSEQLKQFRKKQLYTNLSTQKSDTNINHEELYLMKQSRFNEDHHNTESIAQLLSGKMGSNLNTVRTNRSKQSLEQSEDKTTSQKASLESENIEGKMDANDKEEQNASENGQEDEKQGENYDDYVLGEKIDEKQDKKDKKAMKKKFKADHSGRPLNGYTANTESELRMQQIYINNQKKKLQQLNEDQQIISIMQEYNNNKQHLLNQSKKRHETSRMLAIAHRYEPKLQKTLSLPALRPIKEIIVPESLNDEEEPDLMKRNMLAKGIDPQNKVKLYVERMLKESLSYGKLGFGRKRVRTICEQDLYEQEMMSIVSIRNKLKSKGINIDANTIARGVVNHKNLPNYGEINQYPQPRLPSNPIYKKFPL